MRPGFATGSWHVSSYPVDVRRDFEDLSDQLAAYVSGELGLEPHDGGECNIGGCQKCRVRVQLETIIRNWSNGIPGWTRIGRWDSARRRSLWVRFNHDDGGQIESIELRSGREGGDDHVEIEATAKCFDDLVKVLETQIWSQDT